MKSMLVVLVIIISTQILDTSLNHINTFIINVNSLFWNVCIFIFLIIAFLVVEYLILKYVQPEVKGIKIGGKIHSTSLHFCVMIAQYVLARSYWSSEQIVMNSQYETRLLISSAGCQLFYKYFYDGNFDTAFFSRFLPNRKRVVLCYGRAYC